MTLEGIRAAKNVARNPYAWPGGYPTFLVMTDGGCLCPSCVKKEWRLIVQAGLWNDRSGWNPAAADINWEDQALFCDHCGNQIEAAYGDQT